MLPFGGDKSGISFVNETTGWFKARTFNLVEYVVNYLSQEMDLKVLHSQHKKGVHDVCNKMHQGEAKTRLPRTCARVG